MKLRTALTGILAAALTGLAAVPVIAVAPASAATAEQCAYDGQCLNFWGGGYDVRTWGGSSYDNAVQVQWISAGKFQLRDNVHGGCVGDYGGSQYDAKLGGGQSCPSSGTAAWGTVFYEAGGCGGGYSLYESQHWGAYIGWAPGGGNGSQVYANTGTDAVCLLQGG